MKEIIIDLPHPGTFPIFARIKPACKYAYQNPVNGEPFAVLIDTNGNWQGNDNQYRINQLEFSWWCDQLQGPC